MHNTIYLASPRTAMSEPNAKRVRVVDAGACLTAEWIMKCRCTAEQTDLMSAHAAYRDAAETALKMYDAGVRPSPEIADEAVSAIVKASVRCYEHDSQLDYLCSRAEDRAMFTMLAAGTASAHAAAVKTLTNMICVKAKHASVRFDFFIGAIHEMLETMRDALCATPEEMQKVREGLKVSLSSYVKELEKRECEDKRMREELDAVLNA